MPVDIELLKRRGGTIENLRRKFDVENIKPGGKIEKFLLQASSRINDGIQQNLDDARIWWAIDRAYDAPKRQVTFTLVEHLLSRKRSSEEVLSAARSWGLESMLMPVFKDGKAVCDPLTKEPQMRLDLPTFFNIYVPVVQAYTKIRWAKLFSERALYPLYKYEPLKLTMRNRIKSDIITDRIQRMASQMGYADDERQSILQTLLYGVCLNFPMEDWFQDKQTILENGKERDIVMKEGIRNAIPHIWRTFYDLTHRASTFNTDTGCDWAGYWDVVRYGDVADNSMYWNRKKVNAHYGRFTWLRGDAWRLYQELFPCRFPFPDINSSASVGAGETDRLNRAFNSFYSTSSDADKAVTLVPLFQKIIPSEWDLYDYKYPVWHRFLFAAEDTVIFASPLAYTPVVAYLYDHDANRAFNTSLGLELLPWQDHISNLLTQYLLSVKQNLAKVVFWNADQLEQSDIDTITNLGEKLYRELRFIPFSESERRWQNQSQQQAFHNVNFPQQNTTEIAQAINVAIAAMERMLGFSSQEIGASASHEESATEVQIKQLNTGVRMAFTGGFLDSGREARKRQLYDAMMAYSDDEIFAEIAEMNDEKKAALEEMGFKIEEPERGYEIKAGVRGSKKALVLEGFASSRDGGDRISDPKIAATMVQTFQAMFSNPAVVEAAGLKQLIEMFNQILYYAGAPRDFRIRFEEGQNAAQQAAAAQEQLGAMQQAMQEQIAQVSQAVAQQVVGQELEGMGQAMKEQVIVPLQEGQQKLAEALVQLIEKQKEDDMRNGIQDEALSKILQIIQSAGAPPPQAMPMAPPPEMAGQMI